MIYSEDKKNYFTSLNKIWNKEGSPPVRAQKVLAD